MKTKPADTAPASGQPAGQDQHGKVLAENMLRNSSVRATEARINVLAVLLDNHCALSHQEVQDALQTMDRVTLYRALDCLTDAGLTHKIAGDDRVFRYSTGSEHADQHVAGGIQHQHGHFKCTRCARVFCLDDEHGYHGAEPAPPSLKEQLQATLQHTLGRGFQSHDIELTIKGWCADCAK
ncbi:Fur family transcriptional regulator [Undibacterium sp.]|jgi:Fur family ferric uptake transcriptional regulator|uniref:Fur family transcriptional regulator n=1 Tax=Undibacterium sp. TaxID=1914977 RepID=UPI002C6D3FD1|nr:Fur family transcriptional regulator [Undibacterium sp.]HTD02536.1 Fur family transcriptional regulator [Undibacterium sp.]